MIRRLVSVDVEVYVELRREALEREPFSFGSSPDQDRVQSLDFVRAMLASSNRAIFGAFEPDLVGIVGIRQNEGRKAAHRAEIWGLYLQAEHRRRGLGSQLVKAAVDFARTLDGVRQVHLCVTERSNAAAALYERMGFVTWGIEPAGLCVDGVEIAERHMILRLSHQSV